MRHFRVYYHQEYSFRSARRRFSLRELYLRRFRRLFPALLVTVFLTLVFAVGLVPPAELAETAESGIYALFSLANFNFWLESGYFDAAADAKPLLHTWSLSVEEQFYLFWPALLLLLVNTRRRLVTTLWIGVQNCPDLRGDWRRKLTTLLCLHSGFCPRNLTGVMHGNRAQNTSPLPGRR